MNCQQLVELVTEYLEGTMPPQTREQFESHLSHCTGCRHYLAQMQSTLKLVGMLKEEHLAAPARDELLNVFRHWKR